ncbi:hypothetical protein HHK36_020914 [Tetracentron sinense]|uniref:CCHC-type domain-containing protein n=1 Tax=Tetracentron sinense TaxID=13715 RepID=A0A835DBH3_TETSI|nr:hypothetical protein HHK36_020914 [Tetracentron sinense]
MAKNPEPEIDDDFNEIYKEYTGPPRSTSINAQEKAKTNKRSQASSDEEEEPRDPNAVPTDFTSREAKVWEAKSKATERNWKKRKEEEMICKLCGESGHFTQGCPSTLGANRKSQDFFERVPAREKHVKALFTEKVIHKIEKDAGCKIKMEEKFIIVSGKDRLCLVKGVDAVHRVIKEEDKKKGSSSSHMTRSRSPEGSPIGSRLGRSESQRSLPSPRNATMFQQRFGREKVVEDRVREDLQQLSRGSPQGRNSIEYIYGVHTKLVNSSLKLNSFPYRLPISVVFNSFNGFLIMLLVAYHFVLQQEVSSYVQPVCASRNKVGFRLTYSSFHEAYGNDGVRGRLSHSKSPSRPHFSGSAYNLYDGHTQSLGAYKSDGCDTETERRESDMHLGRKFEYPAYPQTLEELELEYKREAMELGRIRDKEEDGENYKHRVAVREMRENYMKKLAILRVMHAKQWEEFLQLDIQRRQRARLNISASGFGGYNYSSYSDYDRSSGNTHHVGADLSVDSRSRYPHPVENYPSSRPRDAYGDFQRQRHEDFDKAYNQY